MGKLEEFYGEVRDLIPGGHSSITRRGISPFIPEEVARIKPGSLSGDEERLHEIFPEVFESCPDFMGARFTTMDGYFYWDRSDSERIFLSHGRFDHSGRFRTPMAVYHVPPMRSLGGKKDVHLLFQLGNYGLLMSEGDQELIREGKVRIYRGIGDRSEFIMPSAEAHGDVYARYVASHFLSPVLALSLNGDTARTETNHINSGHLFDFLHNTGLWEAGRYTLHHQSFTTQERTAAQKFGPHYVTAVTPLDNVHLLSKITGESEVRVVNPGLLEDLEMRVGRH